MILGRCIDGIRDKQEAREERRPKDRPLSMMIILAASNTFWEYRAYCKEHSSITGQIQNLTSLFNSISQQILQKEELNLLQELNSLLQNGFQERNQFFIDTLAENRQSQERNLLQELNSLLQNGFQERNQFFIDTLTENRHSQERNLLQELESLLQNGLQERNQLLLQSEQQLMIANAMTQRTLILKEEEQDFYLRTLVYETNKKMHETTTKNEVLSISLNLLYQRMTVMEDTMNTLRRNLFIVQAENRAKDNTIQAQAAKILELEEKLRQSIAAQSSTLAQSQVAEQTTQQNTNSARESRLLQPELGIDQANSQDFDGFVNIGSETQPYTPRFQPSPSLSQQDLNSHSSGFEHISPNNIPASDPTISI